MISGEWKAVWDAAMVAFGHQRIELRVGMALVVAFLALMVLEGLRATFLPRRQARAGEHNVDTAPPPAVTPPKPAKPQARATARAFTPAYGVVAPRVVPPALRQAMAATRKRNATAPSRHRSPRPKIRRAPAAIHGEQSDRLS